MQWMNGGLSPENRNIQKFFLGGNTTENMLSIIRPRQKTRSRRTAANFVCVDGGGEIVGHVSYGTDGQIGTLEQYIYSDEYLDIGIGLRPDLCGKGLGASFVRLCMDFAREKYGQEKFRLSVAAFNERAVKVYKKLGFSIEREVTNSFFGNPFYIMTFSISDKK